MPPSATKNLTLRLPEELHRAAVDAAARSHVSLNELIREATETYLRQKEDQELFDSYTRLGQDLAECDVEYAWDVQREAVDSAGLQD
jgi:hypothetical protein